MTKYPYEERKRARYTSRKTAQLAQEARMAQERGTQLPQDAQDAIFDITKTLEPNQQIDALQGLSDKIHADHISRLMALASNDFNAFCECMNPDEPPAGHWLEWLTDKLQQIEMEPGYNRFVLNTPPGHAKPLSVDTMILMSDGGHKRLGDVQKGDYVIGHSGRSCRVTAVHEQGELDVLELKTKRGRTIITAPDHSFKMGEGSLAEFLRADQLRTGDRLVVSRGPKYKKNRVGVGIDYFELAAYFTVCGGPYRIPKNTNRIFFWTRKEEVCERIAVCLRRLNFNPYVWFDNTNKTFFVMIGIKEAVKLWDILQGDMKVRNKRVPDFVWKGGDADVKKYLSTLVSVAGAIPERYHYARFNLNFKNPALVLDLQELFARYDVHALPSDTACLKNRTRLLLDHHAIESCAKAGIVYDGRYAERLANKRANYLPARKEIVDEVFSIKPAGRAQCRCLTVADDHTFVANGLVVHNSTYASRMFVAWHMGRNPRDKIIGGGHSQTFVENQFSKKIRGIVRSREYKLIFPKIGISADTSAAAQWDLTTGGSYVAKGAGQGVHGYRANFACIDDPYAKVEDAESVATRESIETWFFNDIASRMLPNSQIFLIMTRFHEEDLTGACAKMNPELPERDKWQIITAPAICYAETPTEDILHRKQGEVLWPRPSPGAFGYDIDYFETKRIEFGPQRFNLVYQQLTDAIDPNSVAGQFQYYNRLPHQTDEALKKAAEAGLFEEGTHRPKPPVGDYFRRIVVSVDTASKTSERADYTVAQCWGETHDRKHYLIDQVREKVEINQMVEKIETLAIKWGASQILVEDKGAGTSYLQLRGQTDFQRRLAPCPVVAIQVPSKQGKEFRFGEVAPMITAGEVFIPTKAKWQEGFLKEIGQFPESAHDDQVDALSQYLRWAKSKRTRFGSRKVGSMG